MDESVECPSCGSRTYYYMGTGICRCQKCLTEIWYTGNGEFKRTWNKITGAFSDWVQFKPFG